MAEAAEILTFPRTGFYAKGFDKGELREDRFLRSTQYPKTYNPMVATRLIEVMATTV